MNRINPLDGMSLLARMVIVFLIVILIPTSIIGVISTEVSSRALEKQTGQIKGYSCVASIQPNR